MKAILYKAFLWQTEHTDICKNNKSISGIILPLLSLHGTISEKSEMGKLRKGYCAMKIYEKIFARLEELHMSQTELSRRTGIATSTISDWRKKQINPQADKLV